MPGTHATPDDLTDYYTAGEVDALLAARDKVIVDLSKRVAALEGRPPAPPPAPAIGRLVREGATMRVGAQRFFVGFNDPGLCGHDDGRLPSLAEMDALFSSFAPAIIVRIWALPTMPIAAVVPVVEAILRHGHIPMVALGDGAENPGSPDYRPAFYGGGFRTEFLPHVRRVVEALKGKPRMIWQGMNETAHRGDGPTVDQVVTFEHEVAAAIKAIDPTALVASGVQDTYHGWTDEDAEYRRLLDHPAIDLAVLHDYDLHSVGLTGLHGRFLRNSGIARSLGKPLLVGELGLGSKGAITREQRAAAYGVKVRAYETNEAAGCVVWRLINPAASYQGRSLVDGTNTGHAAARDSWSSPMADAVRTLSRTA